MNPKELREFIAIATFVAMWGVTLLLLLTIF